jgi:hypothetical protein
MARQVAQWVSDFDFCCLVVQLRHASLIALLVRAWAVTGCQKNSTEDLSSISAPKSLAKKKDLLLNWHQSIQVTHLWVIWTYVCL